MITEQQLIGEVQTRGAIPDEAMARRAVAATLEVLGERLDDIHAREVARQLEPRLGEAVLKHADANADFGAGEFFALVAAREGVDERFAVEHARAVCEVLGRSVDETGFKHLTADLPADLAALFARRGDSALRPPPPVGAVHATEHSLSAGRPGGTHPVSEARTDGAHPDSIASTPAPYADLQLSTSPGPTQDREGTTLARGRQGARGR